MEVKALLVFEVVAVSTGVARSNPFWKYFFNLLVFFEKNLNADDDNGENGTNDLDLMLNAFAFFIIK